MAVKREVIYLGYDNTIEFILYKEDDDGRQEEDLSAVTRMTITFGDTTVDSDVVGFGADQPFNWREGNGRLILDFGNLDPAIPVGGYTSTLTVYSPDKPNGIVWGTVKIKVT